MSRRVPEQHLDVIEEILRTRGESSVSEIEDALEAEAPPRRTLQNRIAALVEEGRLRVEGTGRATRYRVSTTPNVEAVGEGTVSESPTPSNGDPRPGLAIALSDAGKEVRDAVSQPLSARTPVGYNQDFLDAYVANETPYLSTEQRESLHRAGRALVPEQPAGTHAKQILARLTLDLSWNSSRLEGNTYSLLDTHRLLEVGTEAPDKERQETQMILNHKEAIEFLVDQADLIDFNRFTVLNLHAMLADNLLPDPASPGRLRQMMVSIGGSVFEPLGVPQRIEECFDKVLETARGIDDPFERAFFAMVHLPYLQPFDDVNKRLSRLAANIPLIKGNLAPLSFEDVSRTNYVQGILGVYELNRVELLRDVFLHAYRRSASRFAAVAQSMSEPDPFRMKHREGLREIAAWVVRHRMDRAEASRHVSEWAAANVAQPERRKFQEAGERELLSLHEGNLVRYGLTLADLGKWKEVWDR